MKARKSIISIGETMKQGKFRVVKAAFVAACLVSVMTSGIASSVSAEPSGVVSSLLAAKTTTSTSVIRKSKVTKTKIVETSIKTVIVSVLTVGKNSAASNTTSDKGTRVLTNSSSVKISATTTVKTVKLLTNTTVTTTVVTTKVETFMKAPVGDLVFKFGMPSAGMSGITLQEAVERINFKYGYQGRIVEMANSDLVVAGGASGTFEMGSASTPSVMKVIQDGAPIRFFGENRRNTWTLVAKDPIKTCANMHGVRLSLHSPGSVTTAMWRVWYKNNCATTIKLTESFINGSPNRLIALLAGRIDVTLLEQEDLVGLPPTGYSVVANFSKDLPQIKTGLIWINQTFLEENPKVAADLMYEISRLAQEVNQDPASFKTLALKWTKGYEATVDKVIAAFRAGNIFPEEPGMFFKDLNESSAFFATAGILLPGLLAEHMAVLPPLKQANKRLGF